VLSIIIFTNGPYTYLLPLLRDIIEVKANLKVWITDYADKIKKRLLINI
jgi:hypothetical protein